MSDIKSRTEHCNPTSAAGIARFLNCGLAGLHELLRVRKMIMDHQRDRSFRNDDPIIKRFGTSDLLEYIILGGRYYLPNRNGVLGYFDSRCEKFSDFVRTELDQVIPKDKFTKEIETYKRYHPELREELHMSKEGWSDYHLGWLTTPLSSDLTFPTEMDICPACNIGWNLEDVHDAHRMYDRGHWFHAQCWKMVVGTEEAEEFYDIFADVGIEPICLQVVPNEYENGTAKLERPWFTVDTPLAKFKVGRRKRVINLELLEVYRTDKVLDFNELFKDEDVTKGTEGGKSPEGDGYSTYIHAWGTVKLMEYLKKAYGEIKRSVIDNGVVEKVDYRIVRSFEPGQDRVTSEQITRGNEIYVPEEPTHPVKPMSEEMKMSLRSKGIVA